MPPGDIAARDFLRNLALFRNLPAEALDRLAGASSVVRAPSGTTLFSRGDACGGVHVIVYGLVKLAITSRAGSEKVIDLLGPGQSLGESFVFFDRPHIGFAETIADSLLVFVGKASLLREVERTSALAGNMLSRLAERVQRYAADLEADALAGGAGRLAAFLLSQTGHADHASEDFQVVELPVCKTVLASRLSVTREHLSRLLRQLSEKRLIEVHGRQVRIHDVARLREFTHQPR
jgi:CRP-like cAMP-binding protein